MTSNPELIKFIVEAKRRGFSSNEIVQPLLKRGWPEKQVNEAFKEAVKSFSKEKISIYLDSEVLKIIKKRAKKNLLSVEEQIEDIVRRSCVNARKKKQTSENIDDLLLSIFSRRRYE